MTCANQKCTAQTAVTAGINLFLKISEVKNEMAKVRYVLEKAPKRDPNEPIEKISVTKLRQLAIDKQLDELGVASSEETTVAEIGEKRFRIRYRDPELGIFKTQTFSPYISKAGRLVVVGGNEEVELTPEMIKAQFRK